MAKLTDRLLMRSTSFADSFSPGLPAACPITLPGFEYFSLRSAQLKNHVQSGHHLHRTLISAARLELARFKNTTEWKHPLKVAQSRVCRSLSPLKTAEPLTGESKHQTCDKFTCAYDELF
jgi:hypothetical protein